MRKGKKKRKVTMVRTEERRGGEVVEEQKKNAGTARVSNRICLICPERRLRQPASKRIY